VCKFLATPVARAMRRRWANQPCTVGYVGERAIQRLVQFQQKPRGFPRRPHAARWQVPPATRWIGVIGWVAAFPKIAARDGSVQLLPVWHVPGSAPRRMTSTTHAQTWICSCWPGIIEVMHVCREISVQHDIRPRREHTAPKEKEGIAGELRFSLHAHFIHHSRTAGGNGNP